MKAVALTPGTNHLDIVDVTEPIVQKDHDVKLKVLEVGICGTDREEASGGRADAPTGDKTLIIGHEMFGQVVEVGKAVTAVKPGDYAVVTVRRGCGKCPACAASCYDMCYTGEYTERGIKARHGFQTEYVVDEEKFIVRVPDEVRDVGVLSEPTSVVEKAIDEAARLQAARLPGIASPEEWLEGKQVLIAGLGPIGLLAAFVLRLRGAKVLGLDIVEDNTARPQLLREIGGIYIDGRKQRPVQFVNTFGQIDMILEATGIASLDFDLLEALGFNGVYVLTGVPGGQRPVSIDGATLMRELVLKNQVMFGSVNAGMMHFKMAVEDLKKSKEKWGNALSKIITHRHPYTQIQDVLHTHPADEIKAIVEWSK
jgi:threonine dehydrogenase-like Zn-dependent dehydrogenase